MLSERSSRQQRRPPVITYLSSPKPIHVKAEDFQSLVQKLTSGTRKRKAERVGRVSPCSAERPILMLEKNSPSSENSNSQALQMYMETLDQESGTAPPRPQINRGLFPTAGLVKGSKTENRSSVFNFDEHYHHHQDEYPLDPSSAAGFDLSFSPSFSTTDLDSAEYKHDYVDMVSMQAPKRRALSRGSLFLPPLGSVSSCDSGFSSSDWTQDSAYLSPHTLHADKFVERVARTFPCQWKMNAGLEGRDVYNSWSDSRDEWGLLPEVEHILHQDLLLRGRCS